MLTVHFETEVETLKKVCADLGENYEAGGTFFVLREDGEPVGFMRTQMGDFVRITHFKVKNGDINRENREFFLHAMMFKFSLSPIPLEVEGHIPELEKFGFRYEDGFMRIDDSRDINLHGDCKGAQK